MMSLEFLENIMLNHIKILYPNGYKELEKWVQNM